jgi:hypothetical protein
MRNTKERTALVTALLLACTALFAAPEGGGEGQVYGAGLTEATPVTVGELLAHPESYLDQRVRVQGRITDVCPRRGCWIDIEESGAPSPIRFKVEDGEIVFPVDAMGKAVTAEGVFTKIELDRAQAEGYLRHLAEERDEPFDPATVTGPITLYQIRGLGAVVR